MEQSNLINEDLEIQILLENIFCEYGYDFRNYSRTHIKRRILHRISIESKINSISEMTKKILNDKKFFKVVLQDFSICVTEMFRDPLIYKNVRKNIIPILKNKEHIKIWDAGCATGEETYSLAILLKEEGIYNKTEIFATDFSKIALNTAEEGIYPARKIKKYAENYHEAGGTKVFSDYYRMKSDHVIMDKSLRERIIFFEHNLASSSSFDFMDFIICRNVLIYFSKELQNQVVTFFGNSLVDKGILWIGSRESFKYLNCNKYFKPIDSVNNIYVK
ncbi:MAG: CheR family methyltransferase [Bacillota bacterium]|nr:CheR family methyltransferase [Bacillota bacterium]